MMQAKPAHFTLKKSEEFGFGQESSWLDDQIIKAIMQDRLLECMEVVKRNHIYRT